ncbi:hypothetical protein [Bacteroides gallinarum]|uniref:hypothetical protein n=1 Tax=Bacteroides gallinarum TaxID=376806 RepID=UPI0003729C12|nr:hypothetical protein [Bacteroides gallinarum]
MKYINQIVYGNLLVNISLSAANEQKNNVVLFKYGKGGTEIPAVAELTITNDILYLTNDICGSFRIYYWEEDNRLFITDNVFDFLSIEDLENRKCNDFEKIYYKKHGYTSGDSTYFNGIYKLPPCSKLTIKNGNYSISSLWEFSNCPHKSDLLKFKESVKASIIESLKPLQKTERPIVLCFSGGMDSTYIAQRLMELNIKHSLVFFKDSTNKINRKETKTAKKQAELLGKRLYFIDITNKKDKDTEKAIAQMRLFDNHYCRYHFYGLKGIQERWGENTIIINGQNSDCILSFGPSERKYTSFLKRYLLYGQSLTTKRMIAFIIGSIFHKKLSVPTNQEDTLRAFYDNFKYCLVNERTDVNEYNTYIDKKIQQILKQAHFSTLNNIFMYIKVFTYMQGSDCQVVTQSAKYFQMDLLMPFSSPALIKATLCYKNDQMELYHPKYALSL